MSTFSTCTSTTRPSSPTDGDVLFETDTKNVIIWDGSAWRGYQNDGISYNFGSSNSHSGIFDGSGDWIVVGTVGDLNTSSDFTLSAWFNLDGSPSNESIMGAGSGTTTNRVWVAINNSTSIRVGVGSAFDDFTVSTLTSDGTQWYHLVAIVSGTTASLYIDGSSIGSATCTAPTSTAFNDLRLGALNGTGSFGGNTNPFGGYLDEIALFDRAITSSEIGNIYNNKVYLNPLALYRLDDDVTDEVGVYDGTNNGVDFNPTVKPY